MANTWRQPGVSIELTAPAGGVVANEGYMVGELFVIAANGDVAAGKPFVGQAAGVFEIDKVSAQAWAEGDVIYWDDSGKLASNVSGDRAIGRAIAAAANPTSTGLVKLDDASNAALGSAGIADNAVTSAKIAADAVTSAKIANGTIVFADTNMFVSAEQTGTGSAQNIAHGLGATPSAVLVVPTDTAPATTGDYTATEGSHDATNVVVTVTASKKFKVWAFA